jgi:hypothetical protein
MPRKKSPVTPPEIEPGTFRLVAQYLNNYVTPGPHGIKVPRKKVFQVNVEESVKRNHLVVDGGWTPNL